MSFIPIYFIIGALYTALLYLIAPQEKFSLFAAIPLTILWPLFFVLLVYWIGRLFITGKKPPSFKS